MNVHNVLRFERADGSTVPQSASDSVQSSMTTTTSGRTVVVTADLSNAYWRNRDAVQSWTRTFELLDTTLRVTDTCRVGAGVRPVFQLQVPSAPELLANGSVRAGRLLVVPREAAEVTWAAMPSGEFSRGYRLDFRAASGCSFSVELRAQ